MEGDSTNRERTADELRDLGASEDFITAYFTEYDGRHSIVAELDGGFGGSLIDRGDFRASVGGGYFEALWNEGAVSAWARADGSNRAILEKAGLKPVTA
jgi:hypothetical protein